MRAQLHSHAVNDSAVLDLRHPASVRAEVVGSKAANLARAAAAGSPVLPGFVLTTAGAASGAGTPEVLDELRRAWVQLTGDAGVPLVVRSSSTIEDAAESSMAGQFESVLDVVGWSAFLEAVGTVLASAADVVDADGRSRPMAVLVQRQLDARFGGVLFGVDPVTGAADRIVVEVVRSRPDTLVGGTAIADHYVLSQRGRVLERSGPATAPGLDRAVRGRLVRLARGLADHYGGPQDIEWAVDADDRLWLLQSRPVTAVATPAAKGPVLGPGPVAETFPEPLSPLEQDLWVTPLRHGIVRAIQLTGTVGGHHLEQSPVVTTVGGWVVADLELLGLIRGRESVLHRFNPAVILRHLGLAWRVGRARVALPALAADLVATVDAHLDGIDTLSRLQPDVLVRLLDAARRELATVHTYEVLSGMLLAGAAPGPAVPSAAAVALRAVARGRARGMGDGQLVAEAPVVLALSAPALGRPPVLPPDPGPGTDRMAGVDAGPDGPADGPDEVDRLGVRDGLRLRTRWLQELLGRAAWEVGRQLADDGVLDAADQIRQLSFDELVAAAERATVPADLADRSDRPGPPPPATFRLSPSGDMVAVGRPPTAGTAGMPAGGGRGAGEVRHRVGAVEQRADTVLVVRHLEPELASALPGLSGLVAETGSALSHLAILARENDVPTVVGVPDARLRFPPGTRVLVDGLTGEVRELAPGTGTPRHDAVEVGS